jgi:ribosomal protein S18 acetylase RimI-like enzyme
MTVAALAHEIWNEYYVPIIGQATIDYMLPKFQSVGAIREQIGKGLEYYLIADGDGDVGYLAIERQPADGALFISKFYIRQAVRGTGLGRIALAFIDKVCRDDALTSVWLTVAKNNPAVATYRKLGFTIVADLVVDIGQGFVMDDYRMERIAS